MIRIDEMRVKELLATIGVSLKESHEPYMNEEYDDIDIPICLFQFVKN